MAKPGIYIQHTKKEGVKMPRGTKGYAIAKKAIKPDEIVPSLEFINTINKNLNGRPCIYPNNEAGIESFRTNCVEYFAYLQKANEALEESDMLIADVEGLCAFCGITRYTLANYRRRNKEWADLIDFFKNQIAFIKKQLSLKGRIPTVLAIFDMVNNHNYLSTNLFQPEDQIATSPKEDEDFSLEQQIIDSGLVWDDTRKEWVYADN